MGNGFIFKKERYSDKRVVSMEDWEMVVHLHFFCPVTWGYVRNLPDLESAPTKQTLSIPLIPGLIRITSAGFLTTFKFIPEKLEYIPSWNIIYTSAMFSESVLVQAVIVYVVSYALWNLVPRFFIKSALDNIPGPPSQSFLFGKEFWTPSVLSYSRLLTQSSGVFPQVFNVKAWEFHKDIAQKCMNIF